MHKITSKWFYCFFIIALIFFLTSVEKPLSTDVYAEIYQDDDLPVSVEGLTAQAKSDSENKYFIIFYEGFRSGRLEMSSFDANGSFEVVWNTGIDVTNYNDHINQYYYNGEGKFEFIGTYHRITDKTDEILVSNVDIYDNSGNVVFKANVDENTKSEVVTRKLVSCGDLSAIYDDSYFVKNPSVESLELAKLSAVASESAYHSPNAFLENCGFMDIYEADSFTGYDNYGSSRPELPDNVRYTIGRKWIGLNKEEMLHVVIIRGTTGVEEWASNFDLSKLTSTYANQFKNPAESIEKELDRYVLTIPEKTKIWITGHSRGAAVANLLANNLSSKYNVYCYTFASPKTKRSGGSTQYDKTIFNYVNEDDTVPKVPPGYHRFGIDFKYSPSKQMKDTYEKLTGQEYKKTIGQAHSMDMYWSMVETLIEQQNSLIVLNKTFVSLYPSGSFTLKATNGFGGEVDVIWKSSNSDVAKVTEKGAVLALTVGKAIISARVGNNKVICEITVEEPSIKLNKSSATIYINGNRTVQLVPSIKGAKKKVKWSTSNKRIATVTSNGKVTGKNAGTVTITAKANGKSATCKVIVKKKKKVEASATEKRKIKKLISRFDIPVGFLGNPGMYVGEKPKGLTSPFITACSAFNVNQKYWKESNSHDEYGGYGEFIIKESYVKAESRKLFGKTCSVSALPKDEKGSYLLASHKGKNVIISGWSSPYIMYSKIKNISSRRAKTFDVRVDYYMKNHDNSSVKKTMTVVYQVKVAPKSYYGYYVKGVLFV